MPIDDVRVGLLGQADRIAYLDHLMRLDGRERALRFAAGVDDHFVMAHCLRLVGSGTTLVGAMAGDAVRGACEIDGDSGFESADLVLTVEKAWRRKGLGRRLVAQAIAEATRLGFGEVVIQVGGGDVALSRIVEDLSFTRAGRGATAPWVRQAAARMPAAHARPASSWPAAFA